MSEFLYLYRGGERQQSAAGMQQQMERWMTWLKELGERGHLKNAGHPLDRSGKTITGKTKAVTDGPFAEKDMVGGYSLIEAKDLEQAADLAKGCPIFEFGGHVEVRPIMTM